MNRYTLYKDGKVVYCGLSSSVKNFLVSAKQDRALLERVFGKPATSWLSDFLNDRAEIKLYLRGPIGGTRGYLIKEESYESAKQVHRS